MRLDPLAGRLLRRMRLQAGISQKAMADALGQRVQRVNDWEAGRRTIAPGIAEHWERLCEERGTPPEPTQEKRESSESKRLPPHVDPYYALQRLAPDQTEVARNHPAPAPSEPQPQPWIPRVLRERGWSVVDGQVMRPADGGPARRRR
jgi:transcriptional regulator with XRE-family HTH domain